MGVVTLIWAFALVVLQPGCSEVSNTTQKATQAARAMVSEISPPAARSIPNSLMQISHVNLDMDSGMVSGRAAYKPRWCSE